MRLQLEHSDSRFESIRFPKKPERPIRLYWLLASAKPPIDGLPQLTRQWGAHILRGSTPYTAPSQAAPSLPPRLRPCVGEANRTNRFESILWRESNRIESKLFLANRNYSACQRCNKYHVLSNLNPLLNTQQNSVFKYQILA